MESNTLIGASASASTPSGSPATGIGAHEAVAAKLYPEPAARPTDRAPNAEVQALRDTEPARALYHDDSDGQLGRQARDVALAVTPKLEKDALQGQTTIVASILADIGMDRQDVSQLASFAAQYAQRKPTDDELRAHTRTATQELRAKYGEGFDEALAGARALTQRDPRLSKFLAATGLGSHPWLVLRMAELARSPRNTASLKRRG